MTARNPDAVIDLIDNAIEDWDASADAMRWAPEAPAWEPVVVVRVRDLPPLEVSMAKLGDAIRRYFDAVERRPRISRMHQEYGRRRR